MEAVLKQIEQNTSQQVSAFVIVSGTGSEIRTVFAEPVVLDPQYEYCIALSGLQTYNVSPNIVRGKNSSITIFDKSSQEWVDLQLETGSYSLQDINDTLQTLLKEPGAILLVPDTSTLKCWIEIEKGYKVHFKSGDLSTILGFKPGILESGRYSGQFIVNILSVSAINVSVDCVTGSYLDGIRRNILYTFFPNTMIGHKIVEAPSNLLFLPLTVKRLDSLTVTLTDQTFSKIDLRGETLCCQFIIKRS